MNPVAYFLLFVAVIVVIMAGWASYETWLSRRQVTMRHRRKIKRGKGHTRREPDDA